jgi:hypothetical protein
MKPRSKESEMATEKKRRAPAKRQQTQRHGRFAWLAGSVLLLSFLAAACATTGKKTPERLESEPVSFTMII